VLFRTQAIARAGGLPSVERRAASRVAKQRRWTFTPALPRHARAHRAHAVAQRPEDGSSFASPRHARVHRSGLGRGAHADEMLPPLSLLLPSRRTRHHKARPSPSTRTHTHTHPPNFVPPSKPPKTSNHVRQGSQGPFGQGCQGHHEVAGRRQEEGLSHSSRAGCAAAFRRAREGRREADPSLLLPTAARRVRARACARTERLNTEPFLPPLLLLNNAKIPSHQPATSNNSTQPTSRSQRAGLQFPVGRVHRLLKVSERVGPRADGGPFFFRC